MFGKTAAAALTMTTALLDSGNYYYDYDYYYNYEQ